MKVKRGFGLHVGSSSILVVFVLLCLTTFAALSLVSAGADHRLSQKTAQASSNYYLADELAEQHLAEIDAILDTAWILASNAEGYRVLSQSELERWAREVRLPAGSWGAEEGLEPMDYSLSPQALRFVVPIDGARALEVTLELYDYPGPGERGPLFGRNGWRVVLAGETGGGETGPAFWDGSDLGFLLQ